MTRPTLLKIICGFAFVIASYLYAGGDQFERETTEKDNFQLEILKAEQKQFEDFRYGRSREINELAESER